MTQDKFTAVWVSYSSIRDFLVCPRAYYLNNVYKDPHTRHKIRIAAPPLALGQAVHEVLESLSILPVEKRFSESLIPRYNEAWKKITGKRGGFTNDELENAYKQRGSEMLKRIMDNPGPLMNRAVKIHMNLPYYWLSEDDGIILCGKIDWLEYLEVTDSVHIIDFKTSKRDEEGTSLQLPIYHLLAAHCQTRPVTRASYWYIARNNVPTLVELPDIIEANIRVYKIAKEIKLARQLSRFKCPHGTGCNACRPLEAIVNKQAEFVGTDDFNQDMYIVDNNESKTNTESSIL